LQVNKKIKVLDLSNNYLTSSALEYLSESALPLVSLDLQHNHIEKFVAIDFLKQ